MRAREASKLYQDLLGVRFVDGGRDPKTGLDCLGVVRVYLSRVRLVPPGAFPLDRTGTSAADALGWVESDCSVWWDRIGDGPLAATKLGDVVFSVANALPHVAVLVYDRAPRLLLSSSIQRGTYTLPLERAHVQGEIVGVYRLRSQARPACRTQAA